MRPSGATIASGRVGGPGRQRRRPPLAGDREEPRRRGPCRARRRASGGRRAGLRPTPASSRGRKVRRSLRRRRVATRAWWTSSASTPSRTPGSWRRRRITDVLSARRTTSPAVAAPPRVTEPISGGGVPTSPSARATSARGRAGWAPGSLVPGGDQVEQRAVVAEQVDLAKPLGDPRALSTPRRCRRRDVRARPPRASSSTVSPVTVTSRATSSTGARRA